MAFHVDPFVLEPLCHKPYVVEVVTIKIYQTILVAPYIWDGSSSDEIQQWIAVIKFLEPELPHNQIILIADLAA